MQSNMKRKLARAGGWALAKRAVKPIPVVGTVFVIGMAGHTLRRKGLLRGSAHVCLDMLPVVGTAKGLVEVFTGDLIPDKAPRA